MTTDLNPVAKAAQDLADVLYHLGQEYEHAVDTADDSPAVVDAIGVKYPFPKPLPEMAGLVGDWAEHVRKVADNPPGLLAGVAEQLRGDTGKVRDHLNSKRPHDNSPSAEESFKNWQTGGLGGMVGDYAAAFGLEFGDRLADLLDAVAAGGDTEEAAKAVARTIRAGRALR